MNLISRIEQEQREEEYLAPYGMRSVHSVGRLYSEEPDTYRTHFQRDRDRIIHCAAFRRLEYKTQVFIVPMKEQNCRSRLTHTLEVGQVARTLARALRLNEDLVEAIAMAHDIGHPPFGHVGQQVLNEWMQPYGGFEHNLQAHRLVEFLEHRYPRFFGLNLTREVSNALLKHAPEKTQHLLETQVVDLADSIAYDCHDTEDSLAMGMIQEEDLMELCIWQEAYEEVARTIEPKSNKKLFHKFVLKQILNTFVKDALMQSQANIQASGGRTPQDFTQLATRCITHSERIAKKKQALHQFLAERVFQHYKMHQISAKVERCILALFETFYQYPEQLPDSVKPWIQRDGVERAICDFIACYTDREVFAEYKRLFLPE